MSPSLTIPALPTFPTHPKLSTQAGTPPSIKLLTIGDSAVGKTCLILRFAKQTFNPTFITDALKVIHDPEIMIELKAHNKPGLFKAGGDFLYVVMPVNLS